MVRAAILGLRQSSGSQPRRHPIQNKLAIRSRLLNLQCEISGANVVAFGRGGFGLMGEQRYPICHSAQEIPVGWSHSESSPSAQAQMCSLVVDRLLHPTARSTHGRIDLKRLSEQRSDTAKDDDAGGAPE